MLLFEIVASREAAAVVAWSCRQPAEEPAGCRAARRAMIRRLVVLMLLVGGAVLLEPLRVPTEGVIAPRSLFLFGILLLTADTFGALAHDLRLPRLVGLSGRRPGAGPFGRRRRPRRGAPGPRHDEAAGGRSHRAAGRSRAADVRPAGAVPADPPGSWPSRPRRCWSV